MRWILAAAVCTVIIMMFLNGISDLHRGNNSEGRQNLEDGIRRAAVTCYAVEGIYPPALSYLEDRYGIQIDSDRYVVYYDIFAENLMPDITVLENKT